MNPPPSRFIRGRARGGGAYRPYFYFRRNGRTIPAGRGGGAQTAQVPRPRRGYGAPAGFRNFRRAHRGGGELPPLTAALSSSFLRPEFYVAPENALEVSCITVDNPIQCPGWRLYFPREDYKETSELVKRIKVLETHYTNNPSTYDLLAIQNLYCFKLLHKVLLADANLMQLWPTMLADLQANPETTLATFGVAMHSVVTMAGIDASLSQPACNRGHYYPRFTRVRKIYARPMGFMDVQQMALICNDELDRLYCVRGCVTAVGALSAQCSWVAFKCGRCNQEQALKQQSFFPVRPHNCVRSDCHAKSGFIEQRSSPYTQIAPVQIMCLSEYHLQAFDMNVDLPAMLDIELRQELVDSVSLGQDVIVTGILKMRPLADEHQQQANTALSTKSHTFQIYMQALSIEDAQHLGQKFTERDLEAITMINSEPDSFKLLVRSLAPEVYGHELVKAGVLLSLFGGAGSQLHNESEVNVLLVGDPGVGKSSMLHMVSKISPRGFFTGGKRATAAAQQLAISTQGRSHIAVHAGALTSTASGHCSIDDIDRIASQQETLLQVMQSQTLCIPFPSIFATLDTPSAIMATANSARGHYDQSRLITENVRVHPSLLTQFHLVFVMLDKPNRDLDTSLSEHIKALHAGTKKSSAITARYELKPKSNNSMNMPLSEDLENSNYDLEKRLQLSVGLLADEENELDLLPPILIKKFIAYARQQVKPLLTPEAAEEIKTFYMDLRSKADDEKTSTCSTSQLEGLIRLTQARARIDFSSEATKLHVRDVLSIVRQSISDTSVGDYIDRNPSTTAAASSSQSSMARKFIQMLQLRANVLGRRVFDFDELKDIARRAGIACGVTNLVEIVNLQGFLLKKGPNIYEVMEE